MTNKGNGLKYNVSKYAVVHSVNSENNMLKNNADLKHYILQNIEN